jgi:ribosomal protein S9
MSFDLGSVLTGGGISGAIAAVILGIIKAIDLYRKTGHVRETDLVAALGKQNVVESQRNENLAAKLDAMRKRYDDAVDQNGRLRYLLHRNNIDIPPELADAP